MGEGVRMKKGARVAANNASAPTESRTVILTNEVKQQ